MQRRDGSLTLCIQHEAPEGEKRANWIPAPAGPFIIAGSFYGPEASLIDGSYKILGCRRIDQQLFKFAVIDQPIGSGGVFFVGEIPKKHPPYPGKLSSYNSHFILEKLGFVAQFFLFA